MRDYDFTLKYRLNESETDPEKFLGALLAAGCDDVLVGIGQNGRIAFDFSRSAPNALEAISSAIANVQEAIPDAKLVEAKPDYVGLTDIADLFGFSRQYMRKLVVSSGADFPEPVHEGKPTLWHLTEVLSWFKETEKRQIDPTVFEVSRINMQVNIFNICAKAASSFHDGFRFKVEAPNKALQGTFDLQSRNERRLKRP